MPLPEDDKLGILLRDRMDLVFEWDRLKDQANLRKHDITFSEAISVFGDRLAQIFPDEDHSAGERREIIIGHSRTKRLLLVSFTELGRSTRDQEGTARL